VLAAGDAHVITVKRGLEGVVVPSKIYGILAAGKPVIAVAPEECDAVSLGKQRGFGVSASPDDAEAVAQCVKELVGNPTGLQKLGMAAAAAAPDFERGRELQKLAAVIEAAGQGKN
jgi:colanic acid biosynthesis glycosyl transferase WcaI